MKNGVLTRPLLAFFGLSILVSIPTNAQPHRVSYQGTLQVGGSPHNGPADMKFAIIDNLGETLWSNDGTSDMGGEPDEAVTVQVANGFFTVLPGDTSIPIPNMTEELSAANVMGVTDASLRVWVRTGMAPFEQLVPDQPLASAPFALVSESVNGIDVDDDGNVGFGGPASPTERLTVAGGRINPAGVGPSTGIQFSHLHLFEDTDLTLKLTSAGGYNVAFVPEGNVGIGTTSPSAKLHLNLDTSNDIFVMSGNRPNSGVDGFVRSTLLNLDGSNSDKKWSQLIYGSSPQVPGGLAANEFQNVAAVNFWFQESGEALRILNNGNVGIGTAIPETPLTIQQTSNGPAGGLRLMAATAANHWNLHHNDVAEDFAITRNNGTPFFTIRATDGNVGIGTTNPVSPLTVFGSNPQIRILSDQSGATETKSIYQNNDRIWEVGQSFGNVGASKFAIYDSTSGGGRLVIDTAGNVGIGTTSPGQKLTVAGTIESTSGGFKFPDGTTQTTAGAGGVTSLNSRTGAVTIAAGSGVNVNTSGQTITISSPADGITSINSQTGPGITIQAGSGVNISTNGNVITVSASPVNSMSVCSNYFRGSFPNDCGNAEAVDQCNLVCGGQVLVSVASEENCLVNSDTGSCQEFGGNFGDGFECALCCVCAP